MTDLTRRIAELPAEKRALLQQLLAVRGLHAPVAQRPVGDVERISQDALAVVDWGEAAVEAGATAPTSAVTENKAKLRQLYNAVSQELDSGVYGRYAMFLNYGYKTTGNPDFATVTLPDQFLNRNCVRLVLELVGGCALQGRAVLDVGCGRGGTIYVLDTFFHPGRMFGIDLSSRAIAFCHRKNLKRNIAYAEGDAEHIPFGAEQFDVVTNVESSHNYPNIHAFYEGVVRVLKPGGLFLYTDVIRASVLGAHMLFLQELGFQLEQDRDITDNVLASCDEIATERQAVFSARHDAEMVRYILGSPGSGVYADLQSGRSTYRILRLRKA